MNKKWKKYKLSMSYYEWWLHWSRVKFHLFFISFPILNNIFNQHINVCQCFSDHRINKNQWIVHYSDFACCFVCKLTLFTLFFFMVNTKTKITERNALTIDIFDDRYMFIFFLLKYNINLLWLNPKSNWIDVVNKIHVIYTMIYVCKT